ncbi:hypothetical protein M407DRAFT_22272 [Tulasnella calospora MUT 4182]|uniref:Importin subunit alpha n=1 Tax=Tulasnella calospora MUT 4182 TaxID=1051891 RepID=A0A0C3QLM4_9AGAM|nr:hypothetical protein M407DRAFT_22272 [Tulasnella calospora MUT 4182]
MAEETSRDDTVGRAGLTLQGVSEIQAALTEEGKVPEDLVLGFNSEDPQIKKASIIKIREILRKFSPSESVQPVIDTGLVPAIVSLLDSEDTTLQCEAAWIVANIASGTTQQTVQVINAGAIPRLIILSASPDAELADSAAWALANVLGDCAKLQDRVEEEGGVAALVKLVDRGEPGYEKVQRTAVWALFCYVNPRHSRKLSIKKIGHVLPCLARYIRETPVNEANMESIEYAVRALDRIQKHNPRRTDFVTTGVVPRLVKLLADSSSSITLQKGVLNCLGYVVSGSIPDADVAVDAGLLPGLFIPLEAKNEVLRRLALRAASNVAAGGHSQVCALLDSRLLKPVVRILMDDQESTICRREACSTISNLVMRIPGDAKLAQAIIEGRWIEALSAALLIPDRQAKELAVSGIANMLEWNLPQGLEADESPITMLRRASCPQNLRAVRDSRDVDDEDIKKSCQRLLTLFFPDCSRRTRV